MSFFVNCDVYLLNLKEKNKAKIGMEVSANITEEIRELL